MSALVYSSDTDEDSPSTKQPFTVCPKCGRFVKIDGHCECEAIFFGYVHKPEKYQQFTARHIL